MRALILFFAAWGGAALGASAIQCGDVVALRSVGREVVLPLEPGELIYHLNYIALVGTPLQLVLGTSQASGGRVVGGRLVGMTIGEDTPSLSLEIPGGERGPVGVSRVRLSPDGRFLAAMGGAILGGPLVAYDLKAKRIVFSRWSTRNPHTKYREIFRRDLRAALMGDPAAQFTMESVGLDVKGEVGRFRGMPREEQDALIDSATPLFDQLTAMLLGPASESLDENIPTLDADFSPDGTLFLADSLDNIAIRRVTDQGLVQRIHPDLSFREPLPPGGISRFFGGGKEIITFHRQGYVGLWDVATGQNAHLLRLDFEIDFETPMPVVVSPQADFFAVSGRHGNDDVTEIWTSMREARAPELTRVKRFSVANPRRNTGRNADAWDFGRYHAVAFARSSDFLVGAPDGSLSVYSSENYRVRLELKGGHSSPVLQTAFALDGKAAASLSADGGIALWPVDGRGKAVRLAWQGEGAPAHVTFSPDGGHLLVEVHHAPPGTRHIVYRAFLVDVRAVLDRP